MNRTPDISPLALYLVVALVAAALAVAAFGVARLGPSEYPACAPSDPLRWDVETETITCLPRDTMRP